MKALDGAWDSAQCNRPKKRGLYPCGGWGYFSSPHPTPYTPPQRALVRKAGGVYYTPSYIVDYIIKQTIGKILVGKKPEKIQEITILDPACGSGSFLIVAYQFLLDWYLQQYLQNTKKYKKKIYQSLGDNWRLTSTERKRILLSHIYGVDIDQQAVETTKLSLLLKVLEGESGELLNS